MQVVLKDRAAVADETPMVSVAITAYNAEQWLSQTLDSILAQHTSFPVEIVISDDGSKDGTVALVRRYEQQYPNIVRVHDRGFNVGMQRNYYDAFDQCRGRYVAWLDADDYWTDPDKLEIQVAALEADPTVAMCCHYVRWVRRGHNEEVLRERYPTTAPGRYGLADVLRSNFLPSPSVMFRNGLHKKLPDWYLDVAPLGDWPVHVVAALEGGVLLIDRIMADYTLNQNSMFWSHGDLFWQKTDVVFFDHAERIVPRSYHRLIGAEKGKRYEAIAYMLRKKGEFAESRKAAVQAFLSPALTDNVPSKTKALLASVVREVQSFVSPRRAPSAK